MAVATPSFLPAKTVVAGLLVLGALGIPMPGSPEDVDYIEHRRRGLERFLKRVARHPILSASKLFIRFLEVPQAVRGSGLARPFGDASADGLATLLAAVHTTVSSLCGGAGRHDHGDGQRAQHPGPEPVQLAGVQASRTSMPCIADRPAARVANILHASLPPRWT